MQKEMKKTLIALLVALPLVFIMVFFGYFPVHYDIVIHTENIIGEGICQSYGSQVDGHTTVNQVSFYFGSKLETATIQGFYYDVDTLYLVTSDVSAFNITGIDSYIRGIHLTHFDASDIIPEGEVVEGEKARLCSIDRTLHVDVFDPDEGATITISKSFIPAWFWVAYFSGMILIAFLFTFVLSIIFDRFSTLKLPFMSASCIMATLLAGCFFCGSLSYITYVNFLLNWVLLFALALALNAVTTPFLGTLITMAFTIFWYIANYFVIALRGKPIMPADLKAIGTAAEVMGGYTFIPSWKMVLGVVAVVCYAVLFILTWKKNKPEEKESVGKQLLLRGSSIVVAILIMVIGINTSAFKNLNTFAWDATLTKNFHEEGMILTYLKSVINSKVKEPEGYSRELVDSYLDEYQTSDGTASKAIHPTNIIMVMNEAFSDLRTVGLNKNIDVMPFVDSLDENTVEGSLYVGVFGGGTCNTEFEALTGNTLAFLGPGAYPYTEYVTEPLFSLAYYFRNIGYDTEAFHANQSNNWNRNQAYPNLGFEVFHSIEDYAAHGEITYLHDQPSDVNDYLYIKSVSGERTNQPRFFFNVTMQNHSPYERWLDVEKADTVEKFGNNLYLDAQVYLSLIKASDEEVRQLVETYEDSDEPTMIIFFGDHQPGLPGTAINEIYTGVRANLDLFKTRFFIWTNYKTETVHDFAISANYLPWLILEKGNFPLPPYLQMLKEVSEKYPIISSQGVMDADGNVYDNVAVLANDPLIQKYQYVQYANLFDEIDQEWFVGK